MTASDVGDHEGAAAEAPVDRPYCVPFEACGKDDVALVGGKNASLGELLKADAPVPPGFAVTTAFYEAYLDHNDLAEYMLERLEGIGADDPEALAAASDDLQAAILEGAFSPALDDALTAAWADLQQRCHQPPLRVAVRSSATAEDLPEASFAGQYDTYLNVVDEAGLRSHLKDCMASLNTRRAITYRERNGVPHDEVAISVGVQELVEPRAAGVLFTLNPANGDRSKVLIEAAWGLGEAVVDGNVTPDSYLVDKPTFEVVERTISTKTVMTAPTADGVATVEVDADRRDEPCLTPEEVDALTELGKRIERAFGAPQDIEWVVTDGEPPDNVLLLQSRPETAW